MISETIVAYHGTTDEAAESIIHTGTWRVSSNAYDWLGEGIYFFQDAPLRALFLAERKCDHPARRGSATPAIIRARITLTECVDFGDAAWIPMLRLSHERLQLRISDEGNIEPSQLPFVPKTTPRARYELKPGRHSELRPEVMHLLDKAVCDELVFNLRRANMRPALLRAGFVDGYPAYVGSWIFDLAHVQINVLEPAACLNEVRKVPIEEVRALRDEANRRVREFEEEIDQEWGFGQGSFSRP